MAAASPSAAAAAAASPSACASPAELRSSAAYHAARCQRLEEELERSQQAEAQLARDLEIWRLQAQKLMQAWGDSEARADALAAQLARLERGGGSPAAERTAEARKRPAAARPPGRLPPPRPAWEPRSYSPPPSPAARRGTAAAAQDGAPELTQRTLELDAKDCRLRDFARRLDRREQELASREREAEFAAGKLEHISREVRQQEQQLLASSAAAKGRPRPASKPAGKSEGPQRAAERAPASAERAPAVRAAASPSPARPRSASSARRGTKRKKQRPASQPSAAPTPSQRRRKHAEELRRQSRVALGHDELRERPSVPAASQKLAAGRPRQRCMDATVGWSGDGRVLSPRRQVQRAEMLASKERAERVTSPSIPESSRRLAEVRADSRPELWETTATAVAEPAGGGGGGAKQPGTGGRRAATNASMYERGQVFAQEKALRLQLKAAALQRDCDATV